jgi:hypothetical protein
MMKKAMGNSVSSGVYFYRLKAGKKVLTRKMVLLKETGPELTHHQIKERGKVTPCVTARRRRVSKRPVKRPCHCVRRDHDKLNNM